jgi:hypothetical protein
MNFEQLHWIVLQIRTTLTNVHVLLNLSQVYANAPNTVHLSGLSNDRILHLTKEGLSDFVVW